MSAWCRRGERHASQRYPRLTGPPLPFRAVESIHLMPRVKTSMNFEEGGVLGDNWQAKIILPGTKIFFRKPAILKLFSRPGQASKSVEDEYKFQKGSPVQPNDLKKSLTAEHFQTGPEDANPGRESTTEATRFLCDGSKQSILLTVSFEALVAICDELGEADRVRLRFVSRDLRSLIDQGDWYWRRMTTQHMALGAVRALIERTRDLPWSLRFAGEHRIH